MFQKRNAKEKWFKNLVCSADRHNWLCSEVFQDWFHCCPGLSARPGESVRKRFYTFPHGGRGQSGWGGGASGSR